MEPDSLVTLVLCCCCCGEELESLRTPWRLEDVHPPTIFTRAPCAECERSLAMEEAVRQLPADLQDTVRAYLRAGVDVHLVQFDD